MDFLNIVIPCRVGSSRFPSKHLRYVDNSPWILRQYSSLREILQKNKIDANITYALPDTQANDTFALFLEKNGLDVFRGDELNVLKRIKQSVECRQSEWVLRINGDNFFLIDDMFARFFHILKSTDQNFVSNVVKRSFPKGCSLEAIRFDSLFSVDDSIISPEHKEHGFSIFYELMIDGTESLEEVNPCQDLNLAIDYPRDIFLAEQIYLAFGNIINTRDFSDIRSLLEQIKRDNPFLGRFGAYTIAEIGGNHEGNFEYAKRLVNEAILTDVDSIKLQIYSADLIVNPLVSPDRNKHFGRFALTETQYIELLGMIRASGKDVSASVWSVQELKKYCHLLDYIKIGSGDLTDTCMLRAVAETTKPVILSTGLSNDDEILEAVNCLNNNKSLGKKLGILQCSSMYPIPLSEANLNVMRTLSKLFPYHAVGYSDHTVGITALSAAAARGCEILEFHFSDDTKNRDFRDHQVSLDSDMTNQLIERLIEFDLLSGTHYKDLTISETLSKHKKSFRKALYLNRSLKKGDIVRSEDLISLRPDEGISASNLDKVVGKKLMRNVERYEPLNFNFFEVNNDES